MTWQTRWLTLGVAIALSTADPARASAVARVGTVFPLAEIPVVTPSGGTVRHVYVSEGETVHRGQLLLSLDETQLKGEIQLLDAQIKHQAQLRLEHMNVLQAKETLTRDEALFADQNLPAKDLDDARSALKLAEEREAIERDRLAEQRLTLTMKRHALKDLQVFAPADGVMATVQLYGNQVVSAGAKLGDLLRIDQVLVETFVPVAEASHLQVGRAARVEPTDSGGSLPARIRSLGERVDPVTHSIRVKLAVPNGRHRLKPGMPVKVLL